MPHFEVVNQNGEVVTSEQLLGRKTIIYFYPKDNTSGCTAEACSLRDNYAALTERGYNVVGVSKDSVASHRKFIDKYELPFTLLADTTTQMLQDFGAWGEKSMYGKKYMGVLRRTFIFDEQGVLTDIIEKVDTKNHAAQILALQALDLKIDTFAVKEVEKQPAGDDITNGNKYSTPTIGQMGGKTGGKVARDVAKADKSLGEVYCN